MADAVYHWQIIPRAGIGELKFGMPQPETDKYAGVYGKVLRSGSDRIPDSILQDTLAQFGNSLSEIEKQALLELYSEASPDSTSVTEVRENHGLVLRYEKDRLVEIILSIDHKLANLDAKGVFVLPPEQVLA
ncbi:MULTISPECIES: hypothetical protein [Rhizobium]|uniref:Uncharacterized protein n=1 Tax=Rhizobium paranaense TaxID=1650438 RepID=A0A7W8XS78_9HYPH|nr:hypothetical protein [Rhizobium paranaense]MBB5574613.1 hypothetical protein [Rhizobium paranaense]